MKPKTTVVTKSASLILDALAEFVNQTGLPEKTVAIDAGLKSNLISMMKSGSFKPPMKRVMGFKRGMPNLDQHQLTATILTEQFPEEEAQQAIIDFFEYIFSPCNIMAEVQDIWSETAKDASEHGLILPEALSSEEKDQIRSILKNAIQRETKSIMD